MIREINAMQAKFGEADLGILCNKKVGTVAYSKRANSNGAVCNLTCTDSSVHTADVLLSTATPGVLNSGQIKFEP